MQPFGAYRLDNEVICAGTHGLYNGFDTAVSGEDDNGQVSMGRGYGLQNAHTIHARHDKVEDHARDVFAVYTCQDVNRGFATICADNPVSVPAHDFFQNASLCRIVVNDQNRLRHALRYLCFPGAAYPYGHARFQRAVGLGGAVLRPRVPCW